MALGSRNPFPKRNPPIVSNPRDLRSQYEFHNATTPEKNGKKINDIRILRGPNQRQKSKTEWHHC